MITDVNKLCPRLASSPSPFDIYSSLSLSISLFFFFFLKKKKKKRRQATVRNCQVAYTVRHQAYANRIAFISSGSSGHLMKAYHPR